MTSERNYRTEYHKLTNVSDPAFDSDTRLSKVACIHLTSSYSYFR